MHGVCGILSIPQAFNMFTFLSSLSIFKHGISLAGLGSFGEAVTQKLSFSLDAYHSTSLNRVLAQHRLGVENRYLKHAIRLHGSLKPVHIYAVYCISYVSFEDCQRRFQ